MLNGSKARVDPQQAYPSTKKRTRAASDASWAELIEWKKSSSPEVCTKTGAALSITWNLDGEGVRDPLSPGSAKRRRFSIEYLFTEVFGSPTKAEWAAPNSHLRLSLPRVTMGTLDVPGNGRDSATTAMRAMSKDHEAGDLGSCGFADPECAMCFNCALSWVCPYGSPRRIEFELELIQSHMAQKRVEVGARALRVRSVPREDA